MKTGKSRQDNQDRTIKTGQSRHRQHWTQDTEQNIAHKTKKMRNTDTTNRKRD
jgi:hypothetical protein